MSKKQPALITRYKNATAELEERRTENAALQKKLDEAVKTKDSYYLEVQQLCDEIEQIQSVIDAFPGAIPRRATDAYVDTRLLVRFAALLAHRL